MPREICLVVVLVLVAEALIEIPPTCDHKIFCSGRLLHTVQMAGIYNDSKTFVDMRMLDDEAGILRKYAEFMKDMQYKPTKEEIREFVEQNFSTDEELEDWIPADYHTDPPFLNLIMEGKYREFARNLTNMWPLLGRKCTPNAFENPRRISFIPVKNGFIIPGGRFREYYYWDTYWIINGLLISGMNQTAKGMLDNFVSLISRYGFIPNGGRVYYLRRSQPPLFTLMVKNYIDATNDIEWLRENIKYLDKELTYWDDNMTPVDKYGDTFRMARYRPDSLGPRPESYSEDMKTASLFPENERQRVYTDLKAGAESGWDFSSRWLYDRAGALSSNISNIQTSRTLPADLNAFLYKAFKTLSHLYTKLQLSHESMHWLAKAQEMNRAIDAVLWSKHDGIWYDYDLYTGSHRKHFSVSNIVPLWAGIGKTRVSIMDYLRNTKISSYPGGVPTTLDDTGEQWDFPNAWPPLQAIMVEALVQLEQPEAAALAVKLAKKWVDSNMLGFQRTGAMFEKYDATAPGQYGGGGEYDVQEGFGWSNGVALQFLHIFYGHEAQ